MSEAVRAVLRMFRLCPVDLPAPGTVAAADLATSLCDARAALVLACGGRPDPATGHCLPAPLPPVQLDLFEVAA